MACTLSTFLVQRSEQSVLGKWGGTFMARSMTTAQGVSMKEAAIMRAMGSATAATSPTATSLLTANLPTCPTRPHYTCRSAYQGNFHMDHFVQRLNSAMKQTSLENAKRNVDPGHTCVMFHLVAGRLARCSGHSSLHSSAHFTLLHLLRVRTGELGISRSMGIALRKGTGEGGGTPRRRRLI